MPPKAPEFVYTVEYVDVNKNGVPDAGDVDLVRKYQKSGKDGSKLKFISQQIVPHETMSKLADKVQQTVAEQKNATKRKSSQTPRKFKTYGTLPNVNASKQAPQQQQPVMVQDKTGFGHYIKAGAGLEAGRLATDAVVNAIGGLFSGDGGEEGGE